MMRRNMKGLDGHTLLFMRGDSFTDLARPEREISTKDVDIVEDDRFGHVFHYKSNMTSGMIFPASEEFDFKGGEFTMEAYINLDKSTGNNGRNSLMRLNCSNGFFCGAMATFLGNGILRISESINGTSWKKDLNNVSVGYPYDEWFHIAFQRRNGYLETFIDGAKRHTLDIGEDILYSGSRISAIGRMAEFSENGSICGKFSNIRISDIARY